AQVIRALYAFERRGARSGVSDEILLGGAADITLSDELVLRVHGPRPDHLRGVVFNRYLNGRWVPGEADPGKPIVVPNRPADGAVRVEAVSAGPRYFVPLGARQVAAPSGLAMVDRMGAYRAPTGASADTIWFVAAGGTREQVQSPTADDLGLPKRWDTELRSLAQRWTAGATTDEARLAAIESHLKSEFRYSLQHARRTNADPIVDFLLLNRIGHCEYFASGMALLARSLGIPARVVSGFRVRERNPVGDFHVVRGRDAHAWVEAWVDDTWVTYDPTPAAALSAMGSDTTPWVGAVWDWARDRYARVDGAQVRLGLFGSSAVFAGGAAFVLWVRRRRQFGRNSRTRQRTGPVVAGMDLLLSNLARRGLARDPAETLESYAQRIREADGALEPAAVLLERYARLIYGGIGSAEALESDVAGWNQS
ncbi:MAG: transglutaminaseTgpA domain-containing protein, partial [Myxococcota bacterium]